MPIYLPGGRRRSTPAERRNFVAANIRKKCSAVGCTEYRKWTSSWCSNHKGRVAAHGHPEGAVLDAGLVETYRLKFAKWLDLYEDIPQVRAALEVMDALLRGKLIKRRSYAQRELRRLREGERHPGDHATGPTTAREALEVVGAIYWISLYRPDVLKDDVRLTYSLATHLFKMKLMEARARVSNKSGQSYMYRPRPAATSKQDVGGVIRRDLAVFFVNAFTRAEEDYRADARRKMTLKEPMASVTAQLAPSTPGSAGPTPTPAPAQEPPRAPSSAGAGLEPTIAELIARANAVLRKTAPAPSLRPYDPSGPSLQEPYDPAVGPSPQPAPEAPAAPQAPEATPLPPSAQVLSHRPSTSSHHDPEPVANDPDAAAFGTPTGSNFEGFDR